MGIALTDDHRQLEEVARSFLGAHKARTLSRELLDAPEAGRPLFWSELAQLGWLGLHIAEADGGSGFGLLELVVVVEELGRVVAPGPFVPTVTASAVIAAAGSAEQKRRLLPGLLDGSTVAGIGVAGDITIKGGEATGSAGVVLGAGLADLLVLVAGEDVLIVERGRAGLSAEIPENLDPTRRSGRITLADMAVSDADVLVGQRALLLAYTRTIVAAEAVGGAEDALDAAVEYAKVRKQFGRVIGSFQAVKHHLANMAVAAESALALVWDAARAATEDDGQFQLAAAAAATLALPGYVRNAELNIQVHGGIGFTWEHDAHLHLRRAATLDAIFGGGAAEDDLFALSAAGVKRANSLDLPDSAETIRAEVRSVLTAAAAIEDERARRERLIETGCAMPHWPKPWGRAADAVEQLVIEQEFANAQLARPEYGITGWVILTLIQHGTAEQIERFVRPALVGDEVWCQLFSEPEAGSDAAAIKTKATRVEGGWRITGQKVWTSGAHRCRRGLATVRTDPSAPKHEGITTVIIDMSAPGVEVRPLRQITGGAEFNEVFFDNVFVPDDNVVGAPNAGWTVARATLGNERVGIGGGVAGSQGAAEYMVKLGEKYGESVTGARPLVGRFLADDEALRVLNLRRAARSVAGGPPGPEGNITKLLLAEHISDRAHLSARLLGQDVALGSGPAKMVGLMLLASRGMSIAGGTSEITRNQIAERILGMPRDPLVS
ncbi:acyl-CoA dehydrogenase [Nocardia arizonensis]|uniref:acyl-CoA dehydrogenase n=1 Tax=Nocardia arizonensis TaxID=1141647 RepID=UPI0006D2B901|nr:acyl-CoA dehydrogenase [Nocardia arizonensis]